jgi:general secretion pathway protein F
MASFSYKAVTSQGKAAEGRLDAADSRAVVAQLRGMGLIPLSVEEATRAPAASAAPRFRLRRISRKDVLVFTEEFATLIRAGLPLDRSLTIAIELTSSAALKAVLQDVLRRVKSGQSLADSFGAHPKVFSRLHVNMIRAGEAGGVLDAVLDRLVEFERAAEELRSSVVTAMIYPALLTGVGLVSVGILMYFVIPRFAVIFEDLGTPMPPMTLFLLRFSEYTSRYWFIAIGALAAAVAGLRLWWRTPEGSRIRDRVLLRTPLVGETIRKIEVARFTRTLGTLMSSGVPLIAAVRIVQDIVRNQLIAEGISRIAEGAKRGEGVSKPMRAAGVFPALSVHLVEVGEETGRLDAMLLQVADTFEREVRQAVKGLTSILEPLMILVMALIVGVVVLSMLSAIFSINDVNF